jgi:4-cresol dehydrogenase (hydroxylating) flavoprotein subunit
MNSFSEHEASRSSAGGESGPVIATSVAEVIRAVQDARASGQSLYPISTGRNWGYGGAAPVLKSSRLLDLSGMNQILNAAEISLRHPVALVQPGVTQGQLKAFLDRECPQLMFNVTGSGRDTSVLGASLDRGVGYFGPRREDIFGLEVVTGRGELIYTGFRRLGQESPLAHSHPYGFGPILDGLFFQGNFGIVTSACFRLFPKHEAHSALSISLPDTRNLPALIDRMAHLKRSAVLASVAHIGNRARTHSSLQYGVVDYLSNYCGIPAKQALTESVKCLDLISQGEWTGLAAVCGTTAHVASSVKEVRHQLAGIATVREITRRDLDRAYPILHALRKWRWFRAQAAAIHAIRPLHGLVEGIPTDAPIENLLWKYGELGRIAPAQFEASTCGVLFSNPALPLEGHAVADAIEVLQQVAAAHRQTPYVTLDIEGDTTLVAVINLLYDKSDARASEAAFECSNAMLARMLELHLHPYRARVDMMSALIDPHDLYWRYVSGLKETFDPDDVIAPGRYNLTNRR